MQADLARGYASRSTAPGRARSARELRPFGGNLSPMPPSASGPRSKPKAWELRALVTEKSFSFLDCQATELGRPRSWHVGLAVEAFAVVAQELSQQERAQLDVLLRHPEQLLAVLRKALRASP